MRVRRVLGAVLVVIALVALASCSWTAEDTRSATAGLPDVRQQLTAHTWLLDRDDSSLTTRVAPATTLRFGPDDLVSGAGTCNAYRGTFGIDDDHLEVGPLAQTRKACPGDANAPDDEFLAALEKVHDVDATDRDRLVLKDDGGVRLAFTAYDVREQMVGNWTVTSLARDDVLVPVVDGTTLTIDDGGRITATGCNTMSASWTLVDGRFDVGAVTSTLIGCEPRVAAQEVALAAALERVDAIEVVPGRLTLLDGDRVVLVATTEDSTPAVT